MTTDKVIPIHADFIRYTKKPKNLMKGKSKTVYATPAKLKEMVTNGNIVALGHFSKDYPWERGAEFLGQQFFMLDFDNETEGVRFSKDSYLSFEQAKQDKFLQENALFMYTTYSYTEAHNRFRVAFKMNKAVTTKQGALGVNMALINRFHNADVNCKDISRVFYGGLGDSHVFNYDNEIDYDSFIAEYGVNVAELAPAIGNSFNNVSELKTDVTCHEVVAMIHNGEISELQEMLNIQEIVLPNIFVGKKYLKSLNIGRIFNLPIDEDFNDIFHDEKRPSTRIYHNENGDYVYTCFSSSSKFSGDLIEMIKRIRGCNHVEAVEFLFVLFKVRIKVTDDVQIIYNNIDMLIDLLENKELLKAEYPQIYKAFAHPKTRNYVKQIVQLFRNHLYVDPETGEQRVAIALSEETIAEKTGCGDRTAHNLLVRLRLAGVIQALSDNEIPNHILKGMLEHKAKRELLFERKSRRSSMHELLLTDGYLSRVNVQCQNLNAVRFTNNANSQKAIEVAQGAEKRKEIHVQDTDRNVVSFQDRKYIQSLSKYAETLIKKYGYATDNMIIKKFNQGFKFGKVTTAKNIYMRLRGGMISQTELTAITNNKANRETYGLNIKETAKTLYVKGDN